MQDLLFGRTLSVPRSEFSKHPFSSGFGYLIPTCGEVGVGSVAKLRQYQYRICSFIRLFYPGPCSITFTDRIHSRELHVLEMDLMLSSALSSLEAKAWPSEKSSGQLRLESNNHTLPIFMGLQFEDIVIFPLVRSRDVIFVRLLVEQFRRRHH